MEIRETGKALRGDVSIACVPTVGVQYLPRIIQHYSNAHLSPAAQALYDLIRRESERGAD